MACRSPRSAVVALVACVALAGCTKSTAGTGTHAAAAGTARPASSSSPPSSFPSSSSTAASPSVPSSAPPSSTPASVPPCTADIRVIPGAEQGAAGHRALVLVFNNVSSTVTCELFGYPGVDLVTSAGATVAHLRRTLRGMAGGEPAGVTAPQGVVLAPGASASALAEASDVPQGGITDCGNYSLLITVPNQFVAVSGGTATLPRCDAEIHPVVPGTTGGMHS